MNDALHTLKPWIVFAGLVLVVVAACHSAQAVLIPIALAGLLTFVLTWAVTWFQRWIGRVPAVLVVVVLAFTVLGLAGWGLTLSRKLDGGRVGTSDAQPDTPLFAWPSRRVRVTPGGDGSDEDRPQPRLGNRLYRRSPAERALEDPLYREKAAGVVSHLNFLVGHWAAPSLVMTALDQFSRPVRPASLPRSSKLGSVA